MKKLFILSLVGLFLSCGEDKSNSVVFETMERPPDSTEVYSEGVIEGDSVQGFFQEDSILYYRCSAPYEGN